MFKIIRTFISGSKLSYGNWHVKLLTLLAKILKPECYVELGIYHAEVVNKLIPHCEKIYAVDINNESSAFIKKSKKVHFHNVSSELFLDFVIINDIAIDMLFIDADHSFEAVLKDFYGYWPYIKPNGLVLLHDSFPESELHINDGYSGTCYKAIQEIKRNRTNDIEIITIPYPPGLTIVRKKGPFTWEN